MVKLNLKLKRKRFFYFKVVPRVVVWYNLKVGPQKIFIKTRHLHDQPTTYVPPHHVYVPLLATGVLLRRGF